MVCVLALVPGACVRPCAWAGETHESSACELPTLRVVKLRAVCTRALNCTTHNTPARTAQDRKLIVTTRVRHLRSPSELPSAKASAQALAALRACRPACVRWQREKSCIQLDVRWGRVGGDVVRQRAAATLSSLGKGQTMVTKASSQPQDVAGRAKRVLQCAWDSYRANTTLKLQVRRALLCWQAELAARQDSRLTCALVAMQVIDSYAAFCILTACVLVCLSTPQTHVHAHDARSLPATSSHPIITRANPERTRSQHTEPRP